jgi:hypothetical protein
MATAATARCGKSLDEPSYIEHPFQQHWPSFDGDAPGESDAQRQSDAEVTITIAASSVNSALLAALFVASAFSVATSPRATCRGSRSSRSAAARRTAALPGATCTAIVMCADLRCEKGRTRSKRTGATLNAFGEKSVKEFPARFGSAPFIPLDIPLREAGNAYEQMRFALRWHPS